jgi:hypothetical protein
MSLIGCVDTLADTSINGWAADEEDLTAEVSVDVVINSDVAATLPCVEFREDLRAAGIGDGCKGFQYDPSGHLNPGRNDVQVRYADTNVLPKGRGYWVKRRKLRCAAEAGFVAALEEYHEFRPQDQVCGIGEGAEDWRRMLTESQVLFRNYTCLEATLEPAAIQLQEKADVMICAAGCRVSPGLINHLVEHINRPGLLVVGFTDSRGNVEQIHRAFAQGGVPVVKLESVTPWRSGGFDTLALAEVGGASPVPVASEPILAHIHVPKCAGTSLRILLERHFGARYMRLYVDDTYFVYGRESLRTYLRHDPNVRGFSSHHVREFPRWLAGRRMLYMTFLRDPIEQFVSYMTHIQKHYAGITSKSLLEAVPPDAPRLTLREFARWLLTQESDVPFRQNHNVNFFARHSSPTAANSLEAAKTALEGFLFVGITERMEESMGQLRIRARESGVEFPCNPMPFENTSSEFRDDLSWIHPDDEVGSLLLGSVEKDQQLYDWAVEHL